MDVSNESERQGRRNSSFLGPLLRLRLILKKGQIHCKNLSIQELWQRRLMRMKLSDAQLEIFCQKSSKVSKV